MQVLSKTQAHEVVVPWQHEAVAEEGGSVANEEPVDVEEGGDTGDGWHGVMQYSSVYGCFVEVWVCLCLLETSCERSRSLREEQG